MKKLILDNLPQSVIIGGMKTITLNPNEAPEGYIAVRVDKDATCQGCAFTRKDPACPTAFQCDMPDSFRCNSYSREDECNVIYINNSVFS